MSKKHEFTLVKLWHGAKDVLIPNQVFRFRFHLKFTVKHTGEAVSTPHSATIDMKMPVIRLLELAKNSIAIVLQNKILRDKSPADARKWLRDHDPIAYIHAFPGKTPAKPLTKEQMLKALLSEYGSVDAVKAALEANDNDPDDDVA